MKVENMTSPRGNTVANQFILTGFKHFGGPDNLPMSTSRCEVFQSYDSIIAERIFDVVSGDPIIRLDKNYWDYSRTTGKYRNQFLGETKAETQKKIDSGEYILTDLN
jgi:hypothetical protein